MIDRKELIEGLDKAVSAIVKRLDDTDDWQRDMSYENDPPDDREYNIDISFEEYINLDDARDKAIKELKDDGWRDIATCPKIGWFLAYNAGGMVHVTKHSLCFGKKDSLGPHSKPTHWRPLPNPPEEK